MAKRQSNKSRADSLAKRFKKRTSDSHSNNGCIIWLGCSDGRYGKINDNATRKMLYAHRVAYELKFGPIPDGMHVLHKCDVPLCVNPDHLFLGTNDDNHADCVTKNRQSKGEHRPNSKLTDLIVAEMRKRHYVNKETIRSLASEFGVCQQTAEKAIYGQTWKHV